jgi:hypothetical protein
VEVKRVAHPRPLGGRMANPTKLQAKAKNTKLHFLQVLFSLFQQKTLFSRRETNFAPM